MKRRLGEYKGVEIYTTDYGFKCALSEIVFATPEECEEYIDMRLEIDLLEMKRGDRR